MKRVMDIDNLLMWPVLLLWLFQSVFNGVARLCGSTKRFFFGAMPWEADFSTYRVSCRINTQHSPVFYDYEPSLHRAKKTARAVIRELQSRRLRADYGVIFIDRWNDSKQEWTLKKTLQFPALPA